jgi:hypothetical protein
VKSTHFRSKPRRSSGTPRAESTSTRAAVRVRSRFDFRANPLRLCVSRDQTICGLSKAEDSASAPIHCTTISIDRATTEPRRRHEVTIDKNVSFHKAGEISKICELVVPGEAVDMLAGRVVEMKVVGQRPSWLVAAMKSLKGTESFSKLKRGMQILTTPRRSNFNATKPLTALAPIRTRG